MSWSFVHLNLMNSTKMKALSDIELSDTHHLTKQSCKAYEPNSSGTDSLYVVQCYIVERLLC